MELRFEPATVPKIKAIILVATVNTIGAIAIFSQDRILVCSFTIAFVAYHMNN